MSVIKRNWTEAIQGAVNPRVVFNEFEEVASWPESTQSYYDKKLFYVPEDSTPDEIVEAFEDIVTKLAVDDEIDRELRYQEIMHGKEYDDTHTSMEWQHIIATQLFTPGTEFRSRMVEIAALAKSAILAHDRNFN